jgi:hypothetical protein
VRKTVRQQVIDAKLRHLPVIRADGRKAPRVSGTRNRNGGYFSCRDGTRDVGSFDPCNDAVGGDTAKQVQFVGPGIGARLMMQDPAGVVSRIAGEPAQATSAVSGGGFDQEKDLGKWRHSFLIMRQFLIRGTRFDGFLIFVEAFPVCLMRILGASYRCISAVPGVPGGLGADYASR